MNNIKKYTQNIIQTNNNLSSIRLSSIISKRSLLSISLLSICLSYGQKKDENIGNEVVNVVKPYSPTISDAFKVKETPNFDDDETSKKENIQYSIFSFPVASTFTPSKGKASGVEKAVPEKTFANYATLGAGNYGTINADLFITQNVSNTDYFGIMLRHLSSQGGIKNTVLDDKYYNTKLDATYGSRGKDVSWNADLGYQNQIYNWYGLLPNFYTQDVINSINPKQTYHNAYLGGRFALNQNVFKQAKIQFNRFWDAFDSGENHLVAQPEFEVAISDQKIKTNVVLDYINGSFKNDYYNNAASTIKYGYTNIGIQPSIQYKNGDLAANIGLGAFYSLASNGGKNKFFIYPQITASYKVVGDLMIAYAGAEGTLKQNSYKDFVDTNFFVSPTLAIAPTNQQYDIFVGLKGKLANAIGYNIRGSFKNEENKALFTSNIYNLDFTNAAGYAYGNSFTTLYDTVKTTSFYGELKADLNTNIAIGINGTFSSFTTKNQVEAWNLPTIEMAGTVDVNFTKKWSANAKLFFVGERKDQFIKISSTAFFAPYDQTVTLKSYFDLNTQINYKHNERLTFFLKGNNLANQQYQKWTNYPVQGIQGLLGASYKFDF